MNTPYTDPTQSELERLRAENAELRSLRAQKSPRYRQTPEERLATVIAGWLGFAVGAVWGLGFGGVGILLAVPGAGLGLGAVLFTQWALRIEPAE